MASQVTAVRKTCCCFNVRIVTLALAIYHVMMSVLLFIEYSWEVVHGKASCRFSKTGYLRIANLMSSFLLIYMLFIISLSLLMGVVTRREKYLLPFISLQIMDFLLCLMTLLASYIELPAYFNSHRDQVDPSKVPNHLLDFCLSIVTLCSFFIEMPSYLDFKAVDRMNFFSIQKGTSQNQLIKKMIILSIAFIAVLILKVYMIKCVQRCYELIKFMNSDKEDSKDLQKVYLPSYEEALVLPQKTPEEDPASPPPYTEV
ncbi:lysosomal-associated transmembrane protein 5 [Suncus etruscus]|uniref:lysosomal-associated transmembrane protein 5 n=1 Tax=Suncus etruscus TaxID=109475 RepID=UPI002110802B|nr:lysosomal-associated transmembrane protein 5 [Suncus etruscus]